MMHLEYVFHDAQSDIVFKSPEKINEVFAKSDSKLFSLKANNGKGKSWLMTFIISSLIEYPSRAMGGPLLVMTDELLEKIDQLRKHSAGLIQGELRIQLGELIVKVEYELEREKPTRKFALASDPENWSDLDDSVLMSHASFCYLIPENPTKRIQGIKINIKGLLDRISTEDTNRQQLLMQDWRSQTQNTRDEGLIEKLKVELAEATRKRDENLKQLDQLKEESLQSALVDKLQELRKGREEIARLDTDMKQLKERLKKMPELLSSDEENKIISNWNAAQREVKDSELARLVKYIAELGYETSNGFSDVQNAYLSTIQEAGQLARLSDFFEHKSFGSIPFLNKDPQSLSNYKHLLLSKSLQPKIVDFFQKKFSVSDSEKEGLEAIKELISWLERRTDVADKLLRDKLRLPVSGRRLLEMLQDEERDMVEQEKLSRLEQSIEANFSRIPKVLKDFEDVQKRFAKAEKAFKQMQLGLSSDDRSLHLKLKADFREMQSQHGSIESKITELEGYISRNAPTLKVATIKELTDSIAVQRAKIRSGSQNAKEKYQKAQLKNHEYNSKCGDLEGRLRFEQDKSASTIDAKDVERISPYINLMGEFTRFCTSASKRFDEKSSTEVGEKIRGLFGEVARKQLGGEILFDGVKRELQSVDFNSESLVFLNEKGKSTSLPWNRLSTGNSAALFLNSTLHNVIQQDKAVVALIDEVGDMTKQSRSQAFKSVHSNADRFAIFLTAEPSEENVFKIEELQ